MVTKQGQQWIFVRVRAYMMYIQCRCDARSERKQCTKTKDVVSDRPMNVESECVCRMMDYERNHSDIVMSEGRWLQYSKSMIVSI